MAVLGKTQNCANVPASIPPITGLVGFLLFSNLEIHLKI